MSTMVVGHGPLALRRSAARFAKAMGTDPVFLVGTRNRKAQELFEAISTRPGHVVYLSGESGDALAREAWNAIKLLPRTPWTWEAPLLGLGLGERMMWLAKHRALTAPW